MQIASLIASAVLVIGTSAFGQEAGTAAGQGAGASSGDLLHAPAEAPPAEFPGAQYVDSRGCIFVRSKDDGREDWVPRIARSGQMICGAVPSLTTLAGQTPQVRPMARLAQATGGPAEGSDAAAGETTQPIPNIAGTPDPNGLPGRFVQAGSFRSEKTAQEAVQKIAGTGLPVTVKRWRRGRVYYQVVLAGPLHGTVAQERGVRIVQGEGFSDAYLRD